MGLAHTGADGDRLAIADGREEGLGVVDIRSPILQAAGEQVSIGVGDKNCLAVGGRAIGEMERGA